MRELTKPLAAVGSTRAGPLLLPFSKPKYQPATNPGSAPARAARPPAAQASQHSLRLLQETSFGQTLAVVGSTPAGLVPLRFSKPKHQPTTDPGSAPGRAAGPVKLRSTR